ncbi:MAG TPA: hypothetical protein VLS85_00330 [Hanamia sp.]|nr:hypothetical protein [Hanamia sp.]
MERRFDMSDFEQSLKDHADQFKMIPSKRVWNGIYNNLHPGSKWPSITVAIVFLITLVTIGNLNDSTTHYNISANRYLKSPKNSNILQAEYQKQAGNEFGGQNESKINSPEIDLKNTANIAAGEKVTSQRKRTSVTHSISANISAEKSNFQTQPKINLRANNISVNREVPDLQPENTSTNNNATVNQQKSGISVLEELTNIQTLPQLAFAQQPESFKNDLSIPVSYQIFSLPPSESLHLTSIYLNNTESVITDQNIVENQNTSIAINKLHKKKNNRIEWTFYVNPTISTVSFNKKTIQPSGNASSIVVLSNQPSFKLVHSSRFGFETGAEMGIKIAKKFKFITGFNLSYSGYNNVSNLVHPTFATLTLNDNKGGTYSKDYITHYGNGQSQDHINLVNYSIEASIPLGVQYNIWGNEKIKVDIASLLEPSVVLRDNAYLISSDGRYYVNDPLLVRRTNLEGHFGSYITFIGKKIKWHLGPDFRYQLFSTYKNIYPTKEHLINYGIRIGISK